MLFFFIEIFKIDLLSSVYHPTFQKKKKKGKRWENTFIIRNLVLLESTTKLLEI